MNTLVYFGALDDVIFISQCVNSHEALLEHMAGPVHLRSES